MRSNNVGMESARSAHPWIARYSLRVLQLLPSLPTHTAIGWAVSRYPYCVDAAPEDVADKDVDSKLSRGVQRVSNDLRRVLDGARRT
jgi:hypothetical protein